MNRFQAWRSGVAKITRGIRVGQVQALHDLAFEPFHFFGLNIGLMIVPDEMQKTMHRKVREMMQEDAVLIVAFTFKRLVGDNDVAEQGCVPGGRLAGRRKRQHVGRLVDPTLFAVEVANRRIVCKYDTHFAAGC